VGAEAETRAKVNGKADRGRALLETDEVVFRGARRCVVKLDASTRKAARVVGAWLTVGALELELGERAAKWLEKIQHPKSVLGKLGLKPGQTVELINLSDESFAASLERAGAAKADVVFFEVKSSGDLKQLPILRKRLPDHGALWLLRPKGKNAAVGEREAMAAGKAAGLVDVKVVGFSERLSAQKYVVPVKSRKPK
jgi:hypothetical protein